MATDTILLIALLGVVAGSAGGSLYTLRQGNNPWRFLLIFYIIATLVLYLAAMVAKKNKSNSSPTDVFAGLLVDGVITGSVGVVLTLVAIVVANRNKYGGTMNTMLPLLALGVSILALMTTGAVVKATTK